MTARDSAALHIGLMVPINNTTMENELLAWLPPGSTCRTRKIPRGPGMLTRGSVPAYNEGALALAQSLSSTDIDVLVYGCTAAGFLMGPDADVGLASSLAGVTGKPVVTTARSMVNALEATGATRIAVVTPYLDEVNRQLTAFLAASGVRVQRLNSLGATSTQALGRIRAPEVAALARETIGDDCDALFIACSQLPTYAILDELQREWPHPVWSSIRASAWQVHRTLDLPDAFDPPSSSTPALAPSA